jgi:hypothetical protein
MILKESSLNSTWNSESTNGTSNARWAKIRIQETLIVAECHIGQCPFTNTTFRMLAVLPEMTRRGRTKRHNWPLISRKDPPHGNTNILRYCDWREVRDMWHMNTSSTLRRKWSDHPERRASLYEVYIYIYIYIYIYSQCFPNFKHLCTPFRVSAMSVYPLTDITIT